MNGWQVHKSHQLHESTFFKQWERKKCVREALQKFGEELYYVKK